MNTASTRLAFSDFNRLRWALGALGLHERPLWAPGTEPSLLIDSVRLQALTEPLPTTQHTAVVLWDGHNSLTELWHARPQLQQQANLSYCFVGQLPDVMPSMPAGSRPLYPSQWPDTSPDGAAQASSWQVNLRANLQRRLRPWVNQYRNPPLHHTLSQGRQIVFCGVVRPCQMVIDDLFRGSSLSALKPTWHALQGFDWRLHLPSTEARLKHAFEQLRASVQANHTLQAADLAALYALLCLLHRMGTLALLCELQARTVVNEFEVHPHLDPYDAQAYHNNLYLDFGSTRGPESLYPRTVDMHQTGKRFLPLRLLQPHQSLSAYLQQVDAATYWQTCLAHALLANSQLE